MMLYTKKMCLLLAVLICVSYGVLPTSAQGNQWYCVHAKNHERPNVDPPLAYVEQYGGYYIGKDDGEKVIYLTFDAGYENGNVAKILDVLKEKEVPAAFFVLAHLIEKDTGLVNRMLNEGHLVCNHTASHKDMSNITAPSAFAAELNALEQLCLEKTGKELARYYRPPEGKFSESNLKHAQEMGYKTVFWSFAYADWDNQKQPDTQKALDMIISNVHPGEVMLLHPTSAANAAVLGEVIDQCRAMGYRFGTLHELTEKTK